MKKLIILSIFLCGVFSNAFAQPSNDTPCSATSMGTLPTPGACIGGLQDGSATTLNSQTTVGATGASPYVYQTGCSGGGQQSSPALDTWYTFIASGTSVNIAISGFPNASVALWTGACNNLSAWGCMNVPSGGSGTMTAFQLVVGQQYWIEVSGGTSSATDSNFGLSVDNDIDCNDCLLNGSLTANPAPVNGGYVAGQVVTFCYTVSGWDQINTNWFHGVQITMGSGWTGTITNTNPANTLQNIPGPGSDGDWLFYSGGIPGWAGPGFYFDTPDSGTAADDNFGDNCNGTGCEWTFCWDLTVGACTPGMNLNVTVNTSGDGESGSWSNNGCNDDNATTFSAIGVCCVGPVMTSATTATVCSGGTLNIPLTSSPAATSYSWVANSNTNVTGESTSAQSSSTINNTLTNTSTTVQTVTYTVTPTGSCPGTPQTVVVTVNPLVVPTFTAIAAICNGGTFTLPTTSTNGITGTWSPAINNTATTTYTFTPTAGQCASTTTMTVTVNNPVTPTFTAIAPICSGGTITLPTTSTNGFTGTWSPAVNNTATTTYTFTPTAGQCATTTTMSVTVNTPVTPTFTAIAAICSGGTITLPTTSTNSITGTWSPAVNNTATTTYTFTPTAGQCATTTTMTVTVNTPTTPTFTAIAPICSGGTITLPTTSTNSITGTWSPAINNTTTTTYTFTPTAGQCASTTTMTVTVNSQTVPTFAVHPPICSGGTVTLPTTSTNSITGTWSPAINNTTTTTYTFTPTAGQCATTTTMTVSVGTPVTPTFTAIAPICSGGTITLPTTSTNGFTGTWSPAVNNTATTTYTFTPTAGQCATTTTLTVTVNSPITPTFAAIAPICSGGTITLPTTSTNSITGTWSPAVNNTATTTYTFTPTAGQCATTTTMTVTVNTATTPTFAAIAAICSGGTITLPTTSTNSITGTWSPAINNTATTTYTFTPTAGQCATTTTLSVTVNPLVTPTFTAIAPICSGGSITLPTTSTNSINGTWSPAVNNTATTTYTFTPTAGQCANTTTMTVNVGAPVTPSFTAIAPICSGGVINLPTTSLDGFTGTWSPAINNTATTTYTFTPDVGQCATTTTMTVSVGSPVTPTFTAIAPICSGGTFTLPTTSNDGFTGTWSPAINNTATTTYTFTPTAGQCATATTMTVTVNPIPVTNPLSSISACPNDPITISNFTSTPTGSTFDWTNDNTNIGLGASGTGNIPGFTAINSTGSSISATVTVTPTLNGCVGTPASFIITVNDQFDATITPVGPFCETDASVILVAVDAGGTWTGNGITNGSTGAFDPAVAGQGTHTITYTIGGSCGDIQTTTIVVNPNSDATITPAGPFCTNDPALTLTAVDAGGVWSGTGITNSSIGIFDPSIAGNGTFTITYTIGGICGDVQTTTIVVSDQLDATIFPVPTLCEDANTITLTAIDAGGTWSGTGITNSSLGTFDPSVAGPGTHTITYTLAGSCGDVQTTTITVLPNADATITPAGPFCIGNSPFTLTAVDAGGTWSGNGITNSSTGIFDPAIAGIGGHTITYNIPGQCGDVATISIEVVANFDATITPVSAVCEDAGVIDLTVANSGGTFSGTGITDPINGIFDPAVSGPGTFVITYTIPGVCGDVQTTTIVVNPLPIVSFSVDNTSGCVPVTATFTDNSGVSGSTVVWSMSDGFISTTNGSVTHTFNSVGCFDVTLQVTSAQGCVSSQTQNDIVCTSQIPNAEFSWNPTDATITNPTINFINESTGATIYDWDFAGLGTSNLTNPTFTFSNTIPGIYEVCLTASNVDGCLDTVCHDITIHDEFIIYAPNAFTPDNDGTNDIFLPIVSGHDPLSYNLMIFNRWGELIFETEFSGQGWDGTYRSILSQEDVYVWKIKVKEDSNGLLHEYIGHVTLLR